MHGFLNHQDNLWLANNSWLNYELDFHISIYCSMRFESYPFDVQDCLVTFGSYAYDKSELILTAYILDSNGIEQIVLLDFYSFVEPVSESEQLEVYDGKYWSVNGFKIRFQRKANRYVVNYFIPAGLMVTISWVR